MDSNGTSGHARPLTLRQQQALARQEQILEIAQRLFAAQGFAATTTKQIAAEAGITEGLIYRYFPKKTDLLKALVERNHRFAEQLTQQIEKSGQRPVQEALPLIARTLLSIHKQEQEFVIMILSEAHSNPELHGLFPEVVQTMSEQVAVNLAARVRAGELRADLPVHQSAMMLLAPLLLFFIQHHDLPEAQWHREAAAFVDALIQHWLHGAKAP